MARVPLLPAFPRPLLWAHRGLSSRAPENTMASFSLAREEGILGLELDVQCCKSGELVVFHDSLLDRVTGVSGSLADMTLEELRRLDAGGRFDEAFRGERIPLLDEVLETFGTEGYLDIEIKTGRLDGGGVPEALVETLKRHGKYSHAGNISISSFNPLALARFKRLAPQFAAALIWANDKSIPWYLRKGQGRLALACDYLKPEKDLAGRLAGRTGLPVVAWTVDEPGSAEALLAAGCEGLISNRPEILEGFPLR